MAQVSLNFQSKKYYAVYGCEDVGICLSSAWSAKTVSGLALVKATLKNSGRQLGSGGQAVVPQWENPRQEEFYQYSLSYDDTQITDAVNDIIACADVESIIEGCLADSIISTKTTQTPWVESAGEVTLETSTDLVGVGTNTPITKLDVVGGVALPYLAITADVTVDNTHRYLIADATTGNILVTLPTAASAVNADGTSMVFTLKRAVADVSANTVTLDGNGAETIDNVLTQALAAGDSMTVISDGTAWHIVA